MVLFCLKDIFFKVLFFYFCCKTPLAVRDKIKRFQEIAERTNVIGPEKNLYESIKGRWGAEQFGNLNDIVLELGCGRGEYTVGLAQLFPTKNFIGVDIKGDRIWVGSSHAIELGLDNVAFLRTQIQFLPRFFKKNEVSEIWITFPDPRPKLRDEKHRLTNNRYLDIYKEIIVPGGCIHLKTDNTALFEYTLEALDNRNDVKNLIFTRDLYKSPYNNQHFGICTKYEKKFHDLGESIKYLKFQFG